MNNVDGSVLADQVWDTTINAHDIVGEKQNI